MFPIESFFGNETGIMYCKYVYFKLQAFVCEIMYIINITMQS